MKKILAYLSIITATTAILLVGYAVVASAQMKDFSLGIQIVDHGCGREFGGIQKTANFSSEDPNLASKFATDEDGYDPDCARLQLYTASGDIPQNDFRVCIQAVDHVALNEQGSISGYIQQGTLECTPLASEAGGFSGWAFDENQYDFDAVRVVIQKTPNMLPDDQKLQDLRVGLQLSDNQCYEQWGELKFTPWYSVLVDAEERIANGDNSFIYDPWSNFAFDSNARDPDCIRIYLDVKLGADPDGGGRDPQSCQPRACQDGWTFDADQCECTEGGGPGGEGENGESGEGAAIPVPTYYCSITGDPLELSKDSSNNTIGHSVLSWQCVDAETGAAAPGTVTVTNVGNGLPTIGSRNVSPTETTIYAVQRTPGGESGAFELKVFSSHFDEGLPF